MLNEAMDEVVLVKGWKKSANWSFPRGKINKDENDLDCAVREVYEETGFDIRAAGLVKDEKDMKYIEVTMREQHMRLYVFRGVPKDTRFEPKTRKEISKIEWYKLTDLPTLKKNRQQDGSGTEQPALNANKFYMVAPFLNPLKKWIAQQRKKENRYSSHLAAPPKVPEEVSTGDGHDTDLGGAEPAEHGEQVASDLPEVSAPPAFDPTMHLKEILNIGSAQPPQPAQPPPFALPEQAPRPVHMPQVDPEKSHALLALLRKGPPGPPGIPPPHTPFEQISTLPEAQQSPHPSHVRPPPPNHGQPPPPFRAHAEAQIQPSPQYFNGAVAHFPVERTASVDGWQSGAHGAPYQQQNRDPQTGQQRDGQQPQARVPPASALPTLTNHTKALLDVFKAAPSLPVAQAPPAEKPSLGDQVQPPPVGDRSFVSSIKAGGERTPSQYPDTAPPPRLGDAHRTSLLGLFSQPSKPKAAEIPAPRQPLPVELAAADPIVSPREAQAKPSQFDTNDLLLDLLKQDGKGPARHEVANRPSPREGETAATVSGPLNQPEFDLVSKATRQMTSERPRSPPPTNKTLYNPKQPAPVKILTRTEEARTQSPRSPRGLKGQPKRPAREKVASKPPVKPFQPQILRRPQMSEGSEDIPQPTTATGTGTGQRAVTARAALSPSPTVLTSDGGETLTPRRQSTQTDDQKQRLLSLFGGGSDSTPKATTGQPGSGIVSPLSASQAYAADLEMPISTRTSRVPSLASIGSGPAVGRAAGEKRQTGAENKAFLLGYLGRIASQDS